MSQERPTPRLSENPHHWPLLLAEKQKRTANRSTEQKARGVVAPATGPRREELLDRASTMLTDKDRFSLADVVVFTATMAEVAGHISLGTTETLTVVPNIIPTENTAEISIQQSGSDNAQSVNIVYTEGANGPVTRYVIGENFADQPDSAARPYSEGAREYHTGTRAPSEAFQPEIDGRRICEDIFVAHLARAGRIEPDQAQELRTQIEEGTPVTQLAPAH